jgi:type VI secretion system secreted protein Hcp
MASDSSVKIDGFAGEDKRAGREGHTTVIAYDHIVEAKVDDHGAAASRRTHGLVYATLVLDKALYKYYESLKEHGKASPQPIAKVEFFFYRTGNVSQGVFGKGEAAPYYKVVLENAFVSSVQFKMPNSRAKDPNIQAEIETVRVGLSYSKITWQWQDGNVQAVDSWSNAA